MKLGHALTSLTLAWSAAPALVAGADEATDAPAATTTEGSSAPASVPESESTTGDTAPKGDVSTQDGSMQLDTGGTSTRAMHYEGHSAGAYFTTCPSDYEMGTGSQEVKSCTGTSVYVADEVLQENGTWSEVPFTLFAQVKYENIDGTLVPVELREGYGPGMSLVVADDLSMATASGTIDVRTCYVPNVAGGACHDLDQASIEFQVTATSEPETYTGGTAWKEGGNTYVTTGSTTMRTGAATGTVDGTSTGTDVFAHISTAKGTTVEVCHSADCRVAE